MTTNDPVPTSESRRAGWPFLAMAAAAGAVVGGLVVGLVVGLGGDDEQAAPTPQRTAGPVVAEVEQCVEAAATIRRATGVIEQTSRAFRAFDPDRLLPLLDRLEDLDRQARRQAAACVGTSDPLSGPVATSTPR